jgi:hypothetical protein
LVEIQANGEFHRFDPMEVMPTKAEVAKLAKKAGDQGFLLFPEDRRNSIRMLDAVPFKWVASGPSQAFTGEVQPNEWYPWQIGVWAAGKELKNLKVEISDFKNAAGEVIEKSAFTCFNTEGVDARGKAFTAAPSVPQGAVQPLWLMAETLGRDTIVRFDAPAENLSLTFLPDKRTVHGDARHGSCYHSSSVGRQVRSKIASPERIPLTISRKCLNVQAHEFSGSQTNR